MMLLSFMFLATKTNLRTTSGRRMNPMKRAKLRPEHLFTLEGHCIGTTKGLEDPAKLRRMSGTPAMGAALLAAAGRREAEPLDTISCSLRQHPTPSGTGGGWDVWARCARPIRSLSAAATAAADWPQQRNHIESNRQVAR